MTKIPKDLFKGKPRVAPGLHPGIPLNQLKPMKCICGGEVFIPSCNVLYASPLQSVSGGPTLVQVSSGFTCANCGELNKFDTQEIQSLQPPVPRTTQ